MAFVIVPKITSKSDANDKDKKNSNQQSQIISADGFIIKSQTLDNDIKAVGTIRANEEVELRSEVSRKVTSIYFKEASFVRQGQILFKLDATDLLAKLKKLRLQEDLDSMKLRREGDLLEKGLVPQQDFDIMRNDLDQVRADISITSVDISRTLIRAPFSGIVGLRNISKGAYVTPATVLATMQDVSKIKVDFSIPEKYTTIFEKGSRLTFIVDGITDEFEAEIYAYEPKVDGDTRTLVLRAICDNPKNKLLPGTFANVTLKLSQSKNAMIIPTQAIVPKLKGQSVYVVKNGIVKFIDVELGTRTDANVQVISPDLQEGDTVVTSNILRLKPDAKVKIEKITQ